MQTLNSLKMYKILGLLLALSAVSAADMDDVECYQSVMKCMEPIKNYTESVKGGHFVPYMTVEQFNVFCSKYGEADGCLSALDCREEFMLAFKGLDDGMKFICEEQPDKYAGYANCISHFVVHSEMYTCQKNLNESMQKQQQKQQQQQQQTETGYKVEAFCEGYNDYLHCGYTTLESHCTPDEAFWFEEVLVRFLEPPMDFYGCDIDRPSMKNSPSAGLVAGVVICVILLVLVTVGTVVYLYMKRKRSPGKGYQPTKSKEGVV